MNVQKKFGEGTELVWADRKRFLGMPLSFTRYRLVRKGATWFKMFCDIGFFYSDIEELNLYRITDIALNQSLIGKIFNTGTIILTSNDDTHPTLELKNIKDPFKVRDLISNYVEQERKLHNVGLSELKM